MSDAEIDALLRAEGLESEGADALLEWAKGRAAELLAQTQGDPELGPLLREGGEAGVDERATSRRREAAEAEVDERPARRGRGREAEDDERPARRGRGRGKRRAREREAEERAEAEAQARAEAQADVVGEATEGEAASVPADVAEAHESEAASVSVEADASEREHEWQATMHGDEAPAPAHRYEDEVTTPRGEGSSAGPLPPIPSMREPAAQDEEEIDEIEELDAEELEMLEDEPAPEAPPEPSVDAPTFGPPDGTDDIPAWRAALLAAETGSDREAAELIRKEESGMRPLPATVTEPTPIATERLQAEEDEISQHKIDLSDLDGAPE